MKLDDQAQIHNINKKRWHCLKALRRLSEVLIQRNFKKSPTCIAKNTSIYH